MPLYISSKGEEKIISEMNPAYLLSAYKKQRDEGWDVARYPTRHEHEEVLKAMLEQIRSNRANYRVELAVERTSATPERQTKIDEILAKMDADDAEYR